MSGDDENATPSGGGADGSPDDSGLATDGSGQPTDASPAAAGAGGEPTDPASEPTDSGASQAVADSLDRIRRGRRRRAFGWAVLVVVLLYLLFQGLSAVELLTADFRAEYFIESLGEFFPITAIFGIVPFLDIGRYFEFIRQRNLLYDPEVGDLLFSWPPDLPAFFLQELGVFSIFGEAGITLAMGVVGTMLGFPLALLFGVLGSERVLPFPFNFLFRGTMSFIRAIPAIIWTLIFIPFVGLGPASATIAIAFDTIGNLGRLFVDELEEIEEGPVEAMRTTGASKPQVVYFGMLSQVKTSFIAWTLYIVEINVRIAVTVGVVGAGGLGLVVASQENLLDFTDMMATLFCIFLLIISVELFSQRLRSRLRADEKRSWRELIFGFPERFAESVMK